MLENVILKFFGLSRSPKGADIMPIHTNWGQYSSRATSRKTLGSFEESPWIFGPFGKLAQQFAMTPWTMYRPPASNTQRHLPNALKSGSRDYRQRSVKQKLRRKDLVEVEHAFLDVIEAGNPYIDGMTCLEVMALTYLLDGEMAAVIERDSGGNPIAIYPIPTYWISYLPTPETPFYGITFPSQPLDVPMEDVLWAKKPHPKYPYGRGVGAAQALSEDLDADDYARKHVKSYFKNNSTPSLLIGIEDATEEQIQRAKMKWEQSNRGVLRGFSSHFYTGKLKAQQLSRTFRENQTIDLRVFERNTVLQTLGMPPEVMGVLENANRSTIDSAEVLYMRYVVMPVAEKFRACAQKFIDREYARNYLFDYHEIVPEDKENKLSVMRAAPQSFKVNEWRESAGYAPIEGGDQPYVEIEYTSDLEANTDSGQNESNDPEEG